MLEMSAKNAKGARWATGRTEAFSDGVFAIAITLLVLELSVPEQARSDLWRGIAEQWPSYLGYVTSFLTIGAIWLSHHELFGRLRYVNRRIMQFNLLLLMTVSFLPFPTRLIAESIEEADAERAAVIFYGLVLLAISLLVAAMWQTVARTPDLLEADVDVAEVQRIALLSTPRFAFYGVVILVALIAPQVAAFGYLGLAIAAVMMARGEDPGSLPEAGDAGGRRRRRRSRPGTHGTGSADAGDHPGSGLNLDPPTGFDDGSAAG
jgi:uncharacterized membrane protein